MSDNKTVPNAAAILNKARGKNGAPYSIEYWNAAIEAMREYRDLHLKAMLKEITSGDEKVLLKRDIEKTGNNYISKIA